MARAKKRKGGWHLGVPATFRLYWPEQVLDSWRTEVTRSCCAAPDMPDALLLPEPAEPVEPDAVEPEAVEPLVLEPDPEAVEEPEPPEPEPLEDESIRPRTSTFEFT
jgi:hypothetical protein